MSCNAPLRRAVLAAAFLLPVVVVTSGCDKLRSRDHLNKGVQAYRGAKYADAVEHLLADHPNGLPKVLGASVSTA